MPSMDEGVAPAKRPIGLPSPGYFSLISRGLMVMIVTLTAIWVHAYLKGVSVHPTVLPGDANDTDGIFNWHTILMTLAVVGCMTEAVLEYQSPLLSGFTRSTRKKIHCVLQSFAFVLIAVGLVAVIMSYSLKLPTPKPDPPSPHSYLGNFMIILVIFQYFIGLGSYLWPKLSIANRTALGPVHRFLGISVWVLGLATMATGFQEKVTFLEDRGNFSVDELNGYLIQLPGYIVMLLPVLAISTLCQFVAPAQPAIPASNGLSESLLAGNSGDSLA